LESVAPLTVAVSSRHAADNGALSLLCRIAR
jgi:hypothetical protein